MYFGTEVRCAAGRERKGDSRQRRCDGSNGDRDGRRTHGLSLAPASSMGTVRCSRVRGQGVPEAPAANARLVGAGDLAALRSDESRLTLP